MRKVSRRLTYKRLTRGAPWTWRDTHHSPPRTCLSHHREAYHYEIDERLLKIGEFDWLLRLYQHTGLSYASVRPEGGIAYFEDEWEFFATRGCEWLEHVDNHYGIVFRIDFRTASRYGSWKPTPRGMTFVVPIGQYTQSE